MRDNKMRDNRMSHYVNTMLEIKLIMIINIIQFVHSIDVEYFNTF